MHSHVPDIINACIYLALAIGVGFSIRRVLIDQAVHGVEWYTLLGFFSRSCWNLYFYFFLQQWYSIIGVTLLAIAECTYVCMLFYYSRPLRNALILLRNHVYNFVIEPTKDGAERIQGKVVKVEDVSEPKTYWERKALRQKGLL